MPITVDSDIRVFSEDEFHTLAHQVMGIVFDVHNEFGRLLDEEIYKQAIRARCEAAGIVPARREVEIKVCYRDFEKSYFMDLLFASGLMVEAKTVEALSNADQAQALQNLMLTGMQHGLLINLRREKVKKRFVSTTLDLAERRRVVVHNSDWQPVNESSRRLHQIIWELLADWGAFLSVSLYREAIVHFCGGPSVALERIPVYDGDAALGTHEVCLIAEGTALALTAMKDGKAEMKDHLERFLCHTRLDYVQWINMDNHNIEFRTLKNVAGQPRQNNTSLLNFFFLHHSAMMILPVLGAGENALRPTPALGGIVKNCLNRFGNRQFPHSTIRWTLRGEFLSGWSSVGLL